MLLWLAGAAAIAATAANHQGGCSCDSFCAGQCAPLTSRSLPPGLHPRQKTLNLTLYRFTPRSVQRLADTNTGDADGDLGFFVARFALGARCAIEPTNLRCFLAPWRDIVFTRWQVEVDAGFGPYLACNPEYLNAEGTRWDLHRYICSQECVVPPFCPQHRKNSTIGSDGQVTCFCARANRSVGIQQFRASGNSSATRSSPAATLPAVCAYGTSIRGGQCLKGTVSMSLSGNNQSALSEACCSRCLTPNCSGWSLHYNSTAGVHTPVTAASPTSYRCDLFAGKVRATSSCTDGMFAATRDPLPGGNWNWGSMDIIGSGKGDIGTNTGNWLSTPSNGECHGNQRPGDGSACTWRVLDTPTVIESECVRERLAMALLKARPSCFHT
eukprot:SAG31_NODE_8222_length_1494_cov_1.156272_1_plen_383_part_01